MPQRVPQERQPECAMGRDNDAGCTSTHSAWALVRTVRIGRRGANALCGLRWRLVETHASQSVHSKALAIFPTTLEILDMAGLVEPFLRAA
jgi:hypothetical protein